MMTRRTMPTGFGSWFTETRALLTLALPIAASALANMTMNLTDTVMMGQIGTESLAAGSLATNLSFMAIVAAQGLLAAIQPIIAQARGAASARGPADDGHRTAAQTLAGGLVLAVVSAVPIMIFILSLAPIFLAIGIAPPIAAMAQQYADAFVWGVPASHVFCAMRNYVSALERPRIVTVISVAACFVNLGLNWILIFGHAGMPAIGLAGSGYATSVTLYLMTLAIWLYCRQSRVLPPGLWRIGFGALAGAIRTILVLGWPIAAIYLLEVGLFSVSSVLIGTFGPISSAAHQICLGIASFTFMVPMALGQAATVRVGFHSGAAAPAIARRAGLIALGLAVVFMSCMATTLILAAQPILRFYLNTADPSFTAVEALALQLLGVAAIFQIFDGLQTVASGALRGLKDTRIPMLVGAFGYWGLGMPMGASLAFGVGMGPVGLWWGFMTALVAVAFMLCLRFHRLTRRTPDQNRLTPRQTLADAH